MSTPLLVIDGETIQKLAPYPELIQWVREAMVVASAGDVEMPQRWGMVLPEERGRLGLMPGYMGGEVQSAGIKLVSLVPPERRKGSSHLGLNILYDADGLVPEAIFCGATITALRTAAASALATDALARQNASSLAILGAGEQAESHLAAMQCVRDFDEVRIWARDRSKAEQFVEAQRESVAGKLLVANSVSEAIGGADVVCAVTAAREPVLFGEDLEPGMHINLVGSSFRTEREVDDEVVLRSSFFVDYRPSTLAAAGEFLSALEKGLVTEDHIRAEIGEVLAGSKPGRQSDDEITVYKSLGIAAQDIITARRVLEKAQREGLGVQARI